MMALISPAQSGRAQGISLPHAPELKARLRPNLPKFLSPARLADHIGRREGASRSGPAREGRSAMSQPWNATPIGHELSRQETLILCHSGRGTCLGGETCGATVMHSGRPGLDDPN
jgi:hypothetical protein